MLFHIAISFLFLNCTFLHYAESHAIHLNNNLEDHYANITRGIAADALLTVPQLIVKYEYPFENHAVVTADGYILNLHRIPHGKFKPNCTTRRPVAFLQHGILASSGDWVLSGTNKGLAYILAEEGYDVWMGNARGNRYSRNHTYLRPESAQFWDFSWHEIAIYDLPAMIDYVLETTAQKNLYYIGHSQGNTIFYVMCSEIPKYNSKIKAQFSLAPIAYVKHMTSPLLRMLSYVQGGLKEFFQLVGMNEFLPTTEFMAKFADTFCVDGHISQMVCSNIVFALCGYNPSQLNTTLLPVILGHTPAGSSTKQFIHFAQEIRSGHFRQWDYGIWGNIKKYKSFSPPDYKLKKVTVPVYIHHGANDWLAAREDVIKLYNELGNAKAYILVPDPKFNHLDFLFAIDATRLLYNVVLALMKLH